MANLWISQSLTTQEWVVNRSAFLMESIKTHISDYWSTENIDQMQYGQALQAIADEIAQLDAYNNWVIDQADAEALDPVFAHASEAPMFNLPGSMPRANWFDLDYRDFLVRLGQLYLQGSTRETVYNLFLAYATVCRSGTTSIRVDELWKSFSDFEDQHIADIHIPLNLPITHTSQDMLTLFDSIRPAHVMLRLVADPIGHGEFIHTATIQDPFYLKLYVPEDRTPVVLLTWASGDTPPTWFTQSMIAMSPARLSDPQAVESSNGTVTFPDLASKQLDLSWYSLRLEETAEEQNQLTSGLLSPAIGPTARYRSGSHETYLM